MRKKIAIIPAREGSKRIPGKNIRPFCGKPMISYSLSAARDSGLFDEIHVSTDSEKIKSIAESLGFKVPFLRDPKLADDFTPLRPVLQWVLAQYKDRGISFDDCFLIMPTAPLIDANDLKSGWEVYSKNGFKKSCVAVAPYPCPIEWAFKMNDSGELDPVQPGKYAIRSQDLGLKFYDTGTFYIYNAELLTSPDVPVEQQAGDQNCVGFEMSREKAVDIDTSEDWNLAEALFKAKGFR